MAPSCRTWRVTRWAAVLLLPVLIVAVVAPPAGASAARRKKLTLTTVTIGGGISNSFQQEWIAQANGYFKQQGLTVNFVNVTSSNADLLATLVSGSVNFIAGAASSAALVAAQGAPVRSVLCQQYFPPEEIAINASYAAGHNIPISASSKAGALRQMQALKGSHIEVGVTNTTSDSYTDLAADAMTAGLTVGVSSPNDDIDIVTEGSGSNLTAALDSGQIPAISNSPPTTVQPNTMDIQLDYLPPDSENYQLFVSTTAPMISAHGDSVLALVKAILEAWNFQKTHASAALKTLTGMYSDYGITSPEEIDYLVLGANGEIAHEGPTIEMTRAGYNAEAEAIKLSAPGTAIPSYSTWIDNAFAAQAIKAYGLAR